MCFDLYLYSGTSYMECHDAVYECRYYLVGWVAVEIVYSESNLLHSHMASLGASSASTATRQMESKRFLMNEAVRLG